MRTMQGVGIALVFIAILILSGCAENTTRLNNLDSVKIGIITPLTGPTAWLGSWATTTLQLSAEKINAEGGINGRPLLLLFEDAGNSQQASIATSKLLNQDEVTLIYAMTTPVVAGASSVVDQAQTPLFGFTSVQTFAKQYEWVFSDLRDIGNECVALYEKTVTERTERIAFLGNDADFSQTCKESVIQKGAQFVAQEIKLSNEPDAKTQLLKIKEANPDAMLLICWPPDCNIIYRQMLELNFTPQLLLPLTTPLPANPIATKDINKEAIFHNALGTDQAVNIEKPSPELAKFLEDYKTRKGEPMNYGGDVPVTYDNLQEIAVALRKCPSLNNNCIRDKLRETDYTGISGRVKFAGKNTASRASTLIQYENGAWKKID
ncbi:MAG: ABC transporter substrate-binding protein [Candidatus Woesearchaeota archaeon]|nr:ABC transporter substrate-binding protein [Candidatus Woesearchaeota archaeon]